MEGAKYREILHGEEPAQLPVTPARLDDLVEAFGLPPAARVLEIGGDDGRTLVRLAARYGATCVCVDDHPRAVAAARGVAHLVSIVQQDGFAFAASPETFDATLCLSGSWVFGGYRRTLARLAYWTRPGGLVAIGETFAFEPPEAAYFRGRSLAPSAFRSHEGNIAIGLEERLEFFAAWVSSDEEWNGYHEAQFAHARKWVTSNPADPDAAEVESRLNIAEQRFATYDSHAQRWSVYLFRKSATAA